MLNMNNMNTQVLADNMISINGVAIGKLTDTDAQKVWDIVNGMIAAYSGAVNTPKSGLVFADEQPKAKAPREIKPAEDVKVVLDGKDNAVWYTTTSQDVRQVVNAQLKAAGFTYDKEYERPETYKKDYTGKDGVTHKAGSHKLGAWTAMNGTKRNLALGKEWIGKELTVTAAEREAIRTGWAEKAAKRQARG